MTKKSCFSEKLDTALLPRIVSADTILFWIFKILKISNSFSIKISLICNENLNTFLTRLGCTNYSRVETILGNTVIKVTLMFYVRYEWYFSALSTSLESSRPRSCSRASSSLLSFLISFLTLDDLLSKSSINLV